MTLTLTFGMEFLERKSENSSICIHDDDAEISVVTVSLIMMFILNVTLI